ncbi:MAG: hypothetical protein R3F11_03775 [Verrucomicrobiales bacterium]
MREPIRILSDLHLGHPGSLLRVAAMLRPLLDGAASIIFSGDTSRRRDGSPRAKTNASRCATSSRTSGAEATYVTGNHDPDIGGTLPRSARRRVRDPATSFTKISRPGAASWRSAACRCPR